MRTQSGRGLIRKIRNEAKGKCVLIPWLWDSDRSSHVNDTSKMLCVEIIELTLHYSKTLPMQQASPLVSKSYYEL
jgi:hypothetical protein